MFRIYKVVRSPPSAWHFVVTINSVLLPDRKLIAACVCVCIFCAGWRMELANHGLILLQQLNAQREFGFLCDCTVAIGDVFFKAHKAVLAAFSNYFRMLFIHQDRYRKNVLIGRSDPSSDSFLLSHQRIYSTAAKSYRCRHWTFSFSVAEHWTVSKCF